MFTYKIKKYIGSYLAVLNRSDGIIFTGGIGENNAFVRDLILKDMDNLGIILDYKLNQKMILGQEGLITLSSKIKVLVLSTDEELIIARDTQEIISKL